MRDDIAEAFWIIFSPFIDLLAAGISVGGIFIALFWMVVAPLRRR